MKWNSTGGRYGWLVVAIAAVPANLAAAEKSSIRWQKDLRAAAAESERANKPMLIKFSATWCKPCQRMSKHTFRDAGVARHVNGCFIAVAVDVDRHQALAKAAGVTIYPTTVIISPKLQVLKRIAGYHTPTELRKELGGLCRHVDHKTAATPKKTAESSSVAKSPKSVEKAAPLAFDGRCLVSMLDDRKVQPGTPEHTLEFKGRAIRFASADFKRRFQAAPAKYWPARDGTCLVTAVHTGKSLDGNPRYAIIYQKRLWFFVNDEQRKRFAQDPGEYWKKTK